LIADDIVPYNKAWCNFILNVAPNREGLIDDNALAALKTIGQSWKNEGAVSPLPPVEAPIISSNLAKKQATAGSWSNDMNIMDFANDDNFRSSWQSNPSVKSPWLEVDLNREQGFNMITIVEDKPRIKKYRLEYNLNGEWLPLLSSESKGRVNVHRFNRVWGNRIRILIDSYSEPPAIAELGVYNERK